MTEQDYLDPQQFPLTTQAGLSLHQQKMIDAINLDDLRQAQEEGKLLNADEQAVLAELEIKQASKLTTG